MHVPRPPPAAPDDVGFSSAAVGPVRAVVHSKQVLSIDLPRLEPTSILGSKRERMMSRHA